MTGRQPTQLTAGREAARVHRVASTALRMEVEAALRAKALADVRGVQARYNREAGVVNVSVELRPWHTEDEVAAAVATVKGIKDVTKGVGMVTARRVVD